MPAIVITSNREQELPTAFKGRCVYHYITFPEPELMLEIVHKHYPKANAEIVQKCIQLFYQLRELGLERAPSTRELLNWLKYLNTFKKNDGITKIEKLEGMGVLIKTQTDLKTVKRSISKLKI